MIRSLEKHEGFSTDRKKCNLENFTVQKNLVAMKTIKLGQKHYEKMR